MEFKTALLRVKETKEELDQLHRITEEEMKRRYRGVFMVGGVGQKGLLPELKEKKGKGKKMGDR